MFYTATVKWELHEHFEKMSYRNRYYIAGGNGLMKMSIPIQGGREHKSVMEHTTIADTDNWRQKHWRTLVSAYSNAPYFEFYADSLEKIFTDQHENLTAFNLQTIHWLKQQIDISFSEERTSFYQKEYRDALFDLRRMKPGLEDCTICDFPPYYQVFQERNGFIPNLSLLDLLFAEGPYTLRWLKENCEAVIKWSK